MIHHPPGKNASIYKMLLKKYDVEHRTTIVFINIYRNSDTL